MISIASVAALGHKLVGLPQYSTATGTSPFPIHVLLILVGRGLAPYDIDNHVNNFVLPHLIDEPDIVLLRVHRSAAERVKTVIEEAIGIRDRFEGRAIGILSLTANSLWAIRWVHEVAPANSHPPIEATEEMLIDLARCAELSLYADRPGAVLPKSESFHYEGPNGSHYSSYFRGPFAFNSRDSVDGLAFWIVPQVPLQSTILLDSPGLLGVGLGIADYFRVELDCPSDMVPTVEARDYYGEEPALIACRLQSAANSDRPVVILSSIVSSGNSLDAMGSACADAGFEDVSSVVLFGGKGSDADSTPIQMLTMDLTSQPDDVCTSCLEERKPVVRIRRSTGLVEVSALIARARVTQSAGSLAADFFSRYRLYPGVVSVHNDQHDFRRHHVIDISLRTLAATPEFRSRCEAKLEPLRGRTVTVLHPAHDDARALATLVKEYSNAGVIIECNPALLGELSASEREGIRTADLVLVVDDVALTGSRLRQYRAFLNLYGLVDGAGRPEIGSFVGVLRPSSTDRRAAIMDMVDRPTGLLFAEELLLPDWRGPDCPWCAELRQIESMRIPRGSLLERRHSQLAAGGLTSELFIPYSSNDRPEAHGPLLGDADDTEDIIDTGMSRDAMDLGPRSVFGDLQDESQIFVAISSALQVMRDRERKQQDNSLSETFTSPISRVLAPEFYLTGRFYAPVVLCSILRGARRFDLRAAAIEPALRQAVGERFVDLPALRGELLYAMARGVLPRPSEIAEPETRHGMDQSIRGFLSNLSRP